MTVIPDRLMGMLFLMAFAVPLEAQEPQPLTMELRARLDASLNSLGESLKRVRNKDDSHWADAAIFHKGLTWALRYDQDFSPADVALLIKAGERGRQRAGQLEEPPWQSRRGRLALGYQSQVDGSVQPYGLIVPKDYSPEKPARLDIVLHGSTRPVGLSELRFISRFDEGDDKNESPPDQAYFELHPLGRVENCYRWAGETDVFEALEDVCRRYNIDRDRIVLRGMSMGASGTWHLGLKHPDRFVALGPYCGYVDTHRFSETPLPNFVKVGPLPEHQELGLHMLDSVDYAANAGFVPAVACMGEKDVFFDAHVIMGEAFRREGLTLVNLISPGTGHVIDPVTFAEQMRRIGEYSDAGLNRRPRELRFVTWTLKYGDCAWVQLLGLEKHYARAEFRGRLDGASLEIAEPLNITRLAIRPDRVPELPTAIHIGTTNLAWPKTSSEVSKSLVLVKRENSWAIGEGGDDHATSKRPGVQGPIDDAFTTPFLCVRGTGTPWNATANACAEASLARFSQEWHHYFRGELPIKLDTEVTAADLGSKNLILFGDPGSNLWIAKALPQLPLQWSRNALTFGGATYASADHLPALITSSPLPGATDRYLVLNSGHTFREAELAKLNYLLFPRWGDWALLRVGIENSQPVETVLRAGFFDEQWRLPTGKK